MQELKKLIAKLESRIEDHEVINTAISKAPVGWHIEHSLLTMDVIIDALSKSDPGNYKKRFDIRRTVVMLVGVFPRGKVQSPKAVRPTADFDLTTLQLHISHSKEKMKILDHLNSGHYFSHPFLGDLKLKPAVRFLKVHTKHHLHIIGDIMKSRK